MTSHDVEFTATGALAVVKRLYHRLEGGPRSRKDALSSPHTIMTILEILPDEQLKNLFENRSHVRGVFPPTFQVFLTISDDLQRWVEFEITENEQKIDEWSRFRRRSIRISGLGSYWTEI